MISALYVSWKHNTHQTKKEKNGTEDNILFTNFLQTAGNSVVSILDLVLGSVGLEFVNTILRSVVDDQRGLILARSRFYEGKIIT
jgi:hypothetical protein